MTVPAVRRARAAALLLVCAALGCNRATTPAPSDEAAADPPPSVAPNDPSPVADAGAEGDAAADAPTVPPEPEIPGGGPDPLTLAEDHSTSVGGPNHGSLQGGVPLPLHGPGYRFSPIKDPESRYGTVELVAALVRASAVVAQEMPGHDMTFGDLGREQGGDIDGHASHRAGRDVDIYFYMKDEEGNPFVPAKAIPLDPDGKGFDFGDLTDETDDVAVEIDVPRTWRFMQALLSDDALAIQRIYVVEHIRKMLLDEAIERVAPDDVIASFEALTCQPRFPHDDHMHVRAFCSAQDIAGGCEDSRPIYPWHKKRLKAAGAEAVIAKPPKTKKKKKKALKSTEQAREDAGEMHEAVTEFLDRRRAWAKKPRTGRKYCN